MRRRRGRRLPRAARQHSLADAQPKWLGSASDVQLFGEAEPDLGAHGGRPYRHRHRVVPPRRLQLPASPLLHHRLHFPGALLDTLPLLRGALDPSCRRQELQERALQPEVRLPCEVVAKCEGQKVLPRERAQDQSRIMDIHDQCVGFQRGYWPWKAAFERDPFFARHRCRRHGDSHDGVRLLAIGAEVARQVAAQGRPLVRRGVR
mmetsp:Transcript_58909/g.170381  ORF Transcript_58909/g.170381 Transcript_58909/m.170381 type:complete len:205 (+) Transcript_58909:639-1253(+)